MATLPKCDNDCTRMGWIEYIVGADIELHVSAAPDADLNHESVPVFCHDRQEMLYIQGWLVSWNEVEKD